MQSVLLQSQSVLGQVFLGQAFLGQFNTNVVPASGSNALWFTGLILGGLLLFLFFSILVVRQYKRCPSNRILVVFW
jgi:hypothetical protein